MLEAVKPFGLDDPDSEGARANDRFGRLSGVDPTPGVVVLVEPGADVESAGGRAEVRAVASELATVPGIARVVPPAATLLALECEVRLTTFRGRLLPVHHSTPRRPSWRRRPSQ